MDLTFREILMDIVGGELESRGFVLAPVKCHCGYPVYHRRSDAYLEIVQLGRDPNEPSLTVTVSLVYLWADEAHKNLFKSALSDGDLSKVTADDCREKHLLRGHFGNRFFFGDVYLALGAGVVAVEEGAKKPFGIRVKRYRAAQHEGVAKLIVKRLSKAYAWLTQKRAERHDLPQALLAERMDGKQLDYGEGKRVCTVLRSHARDKRYVIVYNEKRAFFTYTYEVLQPCDEEEWRFVCHDYDALPGYWSECAGGSLFGTEQEAFSEIASEPTYRKYFI